MALATMGIWTVASCGGDVGVVAAARGGDQVGRGVDAERVPVGDQFLGVVEQDLERGPGWWPPTRR